MSAIIRLSYTDPQELQLVIDRLKPEIKKCKTSSNDQGKYKKAYIELKDKA